MERFEVGMLAVSRAGHDTGQLYLISRVEGEYLYLVDGRLKTLERPKKKKKKHVQVIREVVDISGMDDAGIRRIIGGNEKECQKQM